MPYPRQIFFVHTRGQSFFSESIKDYESARNPPKNKTFSSSQVIVLSMMNDKFYQSTIKPLFQTNREQPTKNCDRQKGEILNYLSSR